MIAEPWHRHRSLTWCPVDCGGGAIMPWTGKSDFQCCCMHALTNCTVRVTHLLYLSPCR